MPGSDPTLGGPPEAEAPCHCGDECCTPQHEDDDEWPNDRVDLDDDRWTIAGPPIPAEAVCEWEPAASD